jgi:sugar phosphate isomerase/epimerase
MTEQEWLQATDPQPMVELLREKASDRKLRLFGVACCRRIYHLLSDERSRRAVEVAERYADGLSSRLEIDNVIGLAAVAVHEMQASGELAQPWPNDCFAEFHAAKAAVWLLSESSCQAAVEVLRAINRAPLEYKEEEVVGLERAEQAALLRCLLGNPFRAVCLDPSWLAWQNRTIPIIAWSIYGERGFVDLPILADALEEAGCQDQSILGHCRSGDEHVRGCWVIDCLLGKS